MGQTKAQKIARSKPRNANQQFICEESEESEEELNSEEKEIWTELIATDLQMMILQNN